MSSSATTLGHGKVRQQIKKELPGLHLGLENRAVGFDLADW